MPFLPLLWSLLKPYLIKKAAAAVVDYTVTKIRGPKRTPAFEKSLAELLGVEGGFVDHEADTGGATNWGITVGAAKRNGYNGDMKDFPLSQAKMIYWKDYWVERHIRLDTHAGTVGDAIASEIFEQGVNTGVVGTCKRVQRVLNILNRTETLYPDLKVDGWLGDSAQAAFEKLRAMGDLDDLYRWLNIAQGARYMEILENDEDQDQEAFARGWAKRVQMDRGG